MVLPKRISKAQQWFRRHGAILTLGFVIAALGWSHNDQLNQLELNFAAVAQQARGKRTVPKGLVIVALDDFSLQQAANADLSDNSDLNDLAQWPWPRRTYALLLERLFAAGARTVGFDLIFDTPSSHGIADDQAFLEALKRHGDQVVLGVQTISSKGTLAGLSLIDITTSLQDPSLEPNRGLLNGHPDADGVIRQRPGDAAMAIKKQLGSNVPDSLAQALLQLSGKAIEIQDPKGLALLDPYGPPRTITTLPIWQILEANSFQNLKASGQLNDAIVLIGPTAAIFQDLHQTVFSGSEGMPGVEIHATELANRIEKRALWFVPPPPAWSTILAIIAIVIGLLANRWERPLQRIGLLGASAAGLLLVSLIMIGQWGLVLPISSLSLCILATGIVSSGNATIQLQWQKRRLRRTLSRYLSPAVAAEIADQPEEADGLLGGKLVDVVVLMSDIRGFTTFTQDMTAKGEVNGLVLRLNQYFTEIVEAIHSRQGTVDKFIGDATLAVFGTPLKQPGPANAIAAVEAAINMQERLEILNQGWLKDGQPAWEQVIALSYGWVVSGNIGSSSRMDFTVIGDAVNTASRLESIAKQYDQTIVLSEAVAALLPKNWPLTDLGVFTIRGQGQQRVYALRTDLLKSDDQRASSK